LILFRRRKRSGGDLLGRSPSTRTARFAGWFRGYRAAVAGSVAARVILFVGAAAVFFGAGPASAATCALRIVAFS